MVALFPVRRVHRCDLCGGLLSIRDFCGMQYKHAASSACMVLSACVFATENLSGCKIATHDNELSVMARL